MAEKIFREQFTVGEYRFWLMCDPCDDGTTRYYVCADGPDGERAFTRTRQIAGLVSDARAAARRTVIRWVAMQDQEVGGADLDEAKS